MDGNLDLLRCLGITGYTLESSIQVGPLLIRPSELQKHLGRYAQRFVNSTDDDVYQFQHLGSATGIKYRGRFFVVSTDHQRLLGDTGKLGIVCDPGQSVVTPGTMWTVNTPDEITREDDLDFCIYEFLPSDHPDLQLPSQFLAIDRESGISGKVGKIALNIGYPTRLQNVDYYAGDVNLVVTSSYVTLVEKANSGDVYVFETVAEDRYFEDGMSGSPIFEVVREHGAFGVKWLGIVVRGGAHSRRGRVISASFITRQIDRAIFGDV